MSIARLWSMGCEVVVGGATDCTAPLPRLALLGLELLTLGAAPEGEPTLLSPKKLCALCVTGA